MSNRRCLIYQRDHRILLPVSAPNYAEVRDRLRGFSELRQGAGGYHVYQVTELSLWAAAAAGDTAASIVQTLVDFGQHPPPPALVAWVQQYVSRYGLVRLTGSVGSLELESDDIALLSQFEAELGLERGARGLLVPDERRGGVKSALASMGYPVVDEATVRSSACVPYRLRAEVALRPYQQRAVSRFLENRSSGGLVLLPCGAGKTIVGVAIAAGLQARTLVVTPSRTIGEQWHDHFSRYTSLSDRDIGVFRRGRPPRPVTIATYQAITSRGTKSDTALAELLDVPWGLIVYDEAHSLPADVFRQSAAVQSTRRLGLTATLVREDGREREVFALVGPPVYSVPWRDLERHGWIAPVECIELRVRLGDRQRPSEARMLSAKLEVARKVVGRHAGEPTLILAHRLVEVAALARALDAPSVTGQTPEAERRQLYADFRSGRAPRLVLSRVANVGVDLPDASVLIQVSGAFGSRQEEAQRVGRLLRPKNDGRRALFVSLVGDDAREREFAARRQRFLVDQGYRYRVAESEAWLDSLDR